MADKKISQLTAASTPLAGTEVLPIVQSGSTVKASVADIVGAGSSPGSFTTLQSSGKTALNGASIVSSRVANIAYNHATDDVFALNDTNASPWGTWVIGPGSGTGLDTFNFYRSGVGTIVAFGNGLIQLNTPVTVTGDTTVNSGNIVQGTLAKGIDFTANTPAAGMTSQLLNWYEEGTWTPSVATGITSPIYVTQTGTYTRIGNTVFLRCYLSVNGGTTNGGGLTLSGLPFTAGSYAGFSGSFAYVGGGMQQLLATSSLPTIQISATEIAFYKTTGAAFAGTDLSSSTFRVDFSGQYTV